MAFATCGPTAARAMDQGRNRNGKAAPSGLRGGQFTRGAAKTKGARTSRPAEGPANHLWPGAAADVARILGCCDLGLVEPPRPTMCKSGGFMAMAVNGLPVLTAGRGDPGHGLDRLAGCLSAERLMVESPSQAELAAWGSEMRQFAARTFGCAQRSPQAHWKKWAATPPHRPRVGGTMTERLWHSGVIPTWT